MVPEKIYLLKWAARGSRKTPVKKKPKTGEPEGRISGTGGEPGGNRPRAGRRSLPVAPPLLADGVLRTHKAWLVGKTAERDVWNILNVLLLL